VPARTPLARIPTTRAVAAGALSVLAVAGMLVSVGWREASTWADTHPVDPAGVSADGAATVRGVTLTFRGAEVVDQLVGDYGDAAVAPDGWAIWVLTFDVAGADEDVRFGVETSVVASDGSTYTRSDLIGYDGEPEAGWLGGLFLDESGERIDAVLLPDGVEPERVRVVPTDLPRDYWAFDV
jgi:hypothetical protein